MSEAFNHEALWAEEYAACQKELERSSDISPRMCGVAIRALRMTSVSEVMEKLLVIARSTYACEFENCESLATWEYHGYDDAEGQTCDVHKPEAIKVEPSYGHAWIGFDNSTGIDIDAALAAFRAAKDSEMVHMTSLPPPPETKK